MPSSYLGLDVHKIRTQYCLMDPGGEILAEGNLPTVEVAAVVPSQGCAVVLEATGSWHHAYDALCGCADVVKLALPARIKTDRIDARILAYLPRSDLIPRPGRRPRRCATCATSCVVGGQAIVSLRVRRNVSHESGRVRLQLRPPSPPSLCSSMRSLSR